MTIRWKLSIQFEKRFCWHTRLKGQTDYWIIASSITNRSVCCNNNNASCNDTNRADKNRYVNNNIAYNIKRRTLTFTNNTTKQPPYKGRSRWSGGVFGVCSTSGTCRVTWWMTFFLHMSLVVCMYFLYVCVLICSYFPLLVIYPGYYPFHLISGRILSLWLLLNTC